MRRNLIYGVIWAVLVIGGSVFLGNLYNPLQMAAYSRQAFRPDEETLELLEELYSVSFVMDRAPSGNIVNYLPRFGATDPEEALLIAELWGADIELYEDDAQYFFRDPGGRLAVDKFGDRIVFTSSEPPVRLDPPEVSDTEAARYASIYMRNRLHFFDYEESVTSFYDGTFEIQLIERLGNLKNYGFPTIVRIDGEGNIYSAEYNFLSYDRLGSFPIMSQAEAFYHLPLDIDMPVDLQRCTLVYCYRNSILQPCYLFEGEYADGSSFSAFVEATVYY
ncbi:MAG: hypothetical protein FWE68_03485 [Defluviitaleaceae bacterium]|nr:hypothetical protein [Defluviitaleaceae bacterium]